jgi:hypothetical protein
MTLMTQDKLITQVLANGGVDLTLRLTGVYPVIGVPGEWGEFGTCIDYGYLLEAVYPHEARPLLLNVPIDRVVEVMDEIRLRRKKAPQVQG